MKDELFNELLASVQEMDEIVQGKKAAAKTTEFPELDVKLIRVVMQSKENAYGKSGTS